MCSLKNTHKFGVCLPKSVDEANRIDKGNVNGLWTRYISKEMTHIKVEFKLLKDGENIPIRYTIVQYHMIFDVKMEDFHRKSCLVASGHMAETPDTMTYISFVSRETVCLDIVTYTLNNLESKCGDVTNE